MRYYQYHIGDFNNATRYASRIERSIYRDLLDMYYEQESAIDGTSIEKLERRLNVRSTDEKAALHFVLTEYFENQDEFYFSNRCELEIKKYQEKLEGAIKAGKASAEARRKKSAKKQRKVVVLEGLEVDLTDVERTLNDGETNVQPTSNQEPVTSNQEPVTNINTQDWRDEKFEEFYKLYPNKKSKGQAKTTWNYVFTGNKIHSKPENPEALFEQIMKSVDAQSSKILASEETFRKHPSTWLNAQAWLDELIPQPTQSPASNRTTADPLAVNAKWGVQTSMTDEEKRQWMAGESDSDIPSSFLSDNNNEHG